MQLPRLAVTFFTCAEHEQRHVLELNWNLVMTALPALAPALALAQQVAELRFVPRASLPAPLQHASRYTLLPAAASLLMCVVKSG